METAAVRPRMGLPGGRGWDPPAAGPVGALAALSAAGTGHRVAVPKPGVTHCPEEVKSLLGVWGEAALAPCTRLHPTSSVPRNGPRES